jgi:hypothetical protein
VRLLTKARLTQKSDRLMAIRGTIRRLSDQRDWENIYGLWAPFLVQQLLWESYSRDNSAPWSSKRSGVAPTWSWASITGPMGYYFASWSITITNSFSPKVVLALNTPTATQAYDRVASQLTSLTLKGHLFELRIQEYFITRKP